MTLEKWGSPRTPGRIGARHRQLALNGEWVELAKEFLRVGQEGQDGRPGLGRKCRAYLDSPALTQ